MSEQWGPWIEHDRSEAKPRVIFVGDWVSIVHARHGYQEGRVTVFSRWLNVIRYRVRRPRALRELIDMAENLPVPKQREEA